MNADTSANHRAMEAHELTYHRLSHSRNDIGIWAALYAAPRPVTAHRHDFYEVAFALGGSGQHEDEGGTLPFLLGDVWIVRPGQWHAFPLVAGSVRIFNLLLTPAFWSACAALLRQSDRQLMASEEDHSSAGRSSLMSVRHVRLSAQGLERVRPLLLTLAAELRAPDTAGRVGLCAGLVLQVLGLLDRYGTSDVRQSAGMLAAHDDEGVLAAVRYIEEHYAEPLTLQGVEQVRAALDEVMVMQLDQQHDLSRGRPDYERIFVQKVNLWQVHPGMRQYVFNPKLAEIARRLARAPRIR